jgi:hypothetical protein
MSTCDGFNVLQSQVLDIDGGQSTLPVVSSPRSNSADSEYSIPSCYGWWPTASHVAVSGRVSKVSEQAIIEGSLLIFYPGEWTDDGLHVRGTLF